MLNTLLTGCGSFEALINAMFKQLPAILTTSFNLFDCSNFFNATSGFITTSPEILFITLKITEIAYK